MEQSRLSIDMVAQETGFADRDRMRRAFLRVFGQPPQVIQRTSHAARVEAARNLGGTPDYDFALQALQNNYAALSLELRCFGQRAEQRLEPPALRAGGGRASRCPPRF